MCAICQTVNSGMPYGEARRKGGRKGVREQNVKKNAMENGVRHKFTMKSYGIMSTKRAKIML